MIVHSATTLLHIGEVQTVVTNLNDNRSAPPLTLPLGSVTTARHFRHNPPTAVEMENVIQRVEDELFRIRHSIVEGSTLCTADGSVRDIARIAGLSEQPELTLARESVEQLFNRLAAIVQGRPPSQDSIPTTAEFSTTLLILREFMHHLDFASIEVRSQAFVETVARRSSTFPIGCLQ